MKTLEKLSRKKTLVKPSRNKTRKKLPSKKILENVIIILKGEFPDGYLMIRSESESLDIKIYSSKESYLRIPRIKINEFISELRERSSIPGISYRFGEYDQFEILGEKIPKLIKYLRKAKVTRKNNNIDRYF